MPLKDPPRCRLPKQSGAFFRWWRDDVYKCRSWKMRGWQRGTRLCDKIRRIVVNMAEASNDWNCRLSELGLLPPPSSAFVSSVFVSINTVRSILAQARPAVEHGLMKQVLPSCNFLRRSLTRREVWEDYAARFNPVVHDTIRDTINNLHRASMPVVVEEMRQGLNERLRDREYWPVNRIGERGLGKLLLGVGYRYRLRYAKMCSVIHNQQENSEENKANNLGI